MTRNQRLVLVWFAEHCSARGIVRVSNTEIGLIFGWSQPYAKKILNSLVDAEELVVLQKGISHRPTKYQVTSIYHNQIDTTITNSASRPKPPKNVAHHVPSHNQRQSQETQNTVFPKNSLPFRYITTKEKEKEYAQREAHIRNGTVFDNVPSNLKTIKTRSTPFKRFKTHCENVDQWRAPDFVCYFSYIFRVRWGENPELNWKMELGAARTLLSRIPPWKLKVFIQTAALYDKRKPNGLRSYTNDYRFREVAAQRFTADELDEYADDHVFPWLLAKLRQETVAASREYTRKLTMRAFGIYD